MVQVKGVWFALYYRDGKALRKTLKTTNKKEAIRARNLFFLELVADGATVYTGRTAQTKVLDKPNLYIYERPPYIFKVKGKVLLESWDPDEIRTARDEYLKNVDVDASTPTQTP
jgi:hypothetical protein